MENRVEARDFCLTWDRTLNIIQGPSHIISLGKFHPFDDLKLQIILIALCKCHYYKVVHYWVSVIQIKLLLPVFSSFRIHCVPLVSLSCEMPTREDVTALWDYFRPSTIPQISIGSLCIITQPLTSQFYTFNFTVTLLASQDVNSLSNSKISKKVQTLYLTFKNTHDLNPIYFLKNLCLYSSKFISFIKSLLLQKQPTFPLPLTTNKLV